jgi:aryl-alcohol dehydrogenase-like predicted oxidoreductase
MTHSIERIPFGKTGHLSSRALFGAAALGAMNQDRADRTLDQIMSWGLNHIDVAASYGEAELRLAPWLKDNRDSVFLATKTGHRTYEKAKKQIHASLERMQVDQIDLIQMHNLTQADQWEAAMGPGGAMEALVEAKEQGLVRFLGVTGHGTYAPAMHMQSLEAYPFDSILVPYNFTMMQQAQYAHDFDALYNMCQARGVAMQTIKGIAARRWQEGDEEKRFSWYRPIIDAAAMKRAIDYVLDRKNLFINTSSDATLLEPALNCIAEPRAEIDLALLAEDAERLGIEPLFVRDVSDDVIVSAG